MTITRENKATTARCKVSECEEKKKACAGYENHVNGYNVYQDAQITPTNEDKSCLALTSTHTFNQLRIMYTAYMYTLN